MECTFKGKVSLRYIIFKEPGPITAATADVLDINCTGNQRFNTRGHLSVESWIWALTEYTWTPLWIDWEFEIYFQWLLLDLNGPLQREECRQCRWSPSGSPVRVNMITRQRRSSKFTWPSRNCTCSASWTGRNISRPKVCKSNSCF